MKNLETTYIYGIHVEIVFSPDGHIETGFLHNPPERQGLGTEVCLGHCRSFVRPMGVKKLIMGLEDASISTCGILMQFNHIPTVIYNENVRGNSGRRFKGMTLLQFQNLINLVFLMSLFFLFLFFFAFFMSII